MAVDRSIFAEGAEERVGAENLLRVVLGRLDSERAASAAKEVERTGTLKGSLTHDVEARPTGTNVSAAEDGEGSKHTKVSKHSISFKRLSTSGG